MQQDKTIEKIIISNLMLNEDYARKVVPFIKSDYFETRHEQLIVGEILSFYNNYNKPPSVAAISIQINSNHPSYSLECNEYLNDFETGTWIESNQNWLLDASEKFCKDRAVLKAIIDSFEIIEGKSTKYSREGIPSILQDALGVSFNSSVGHDYFSDFSKRYEFYNKKEDKIPFDLTLMNKITNGGLSKKTLNLILAPPKCGKTMMMVHVASSTLLKGKNVLFITMEMAEERIAERIDANLMDVDILEIPNLSKDMFESRINKLVNKTTGRLFIKEYPPLSAHSGHFKALLEELKIKKDFVPDLIVVDYLNIVSSSRIRQGSGVNSYTYVKSVSEELRGLASECNVPILSAVQSNRGSVGSTDMDMTDVSDSFAIVMTTDILFAMIRTEELDKMNQVMIQQIANRYMDSNFYKRFLIGRDPSRMKFYDVENSAQSGLSDTGYGDQVDSDTFDSGLKRNKSVDLDGFKF